MALTLTDKLLKTCDAYCVAVRLSRSRVSTLVFGDGMRLEGVAGGKDLNTRSFERAMLWFSANWPEALAWPEGVERPEPADTAAAESHPAGAAA